MFCSFWTSAVTGPQGEYKRVLNNTSHLLDYIYPRLLPLLLLYPTSYLFFSLESLTRYSVSEAHCLTLFPYCLEIRIDCEHKHPAFSLLCGLTHTTISTSFLRVSTRCLASFASYHITIILTSARSTYHFPSSHHFLSHVTLITSPSHSYIIRGLEPIYTSNSHNIPSTSTAFACEQISIPTSHLNHS